MQSLNYAFEYGELSNSQKQAVITLVEKRGKDKRQIKNWRPISLINVDAKIASKTLAKRLENVLPAKYFTLIREPLSRGEMYLMPSEQLTM